MAGKGGLFCVSALGLLGGVSCGEKPDAYNITIPTLKLNEREAVVSFTLPIRGGTVQNMLSLPVGWSVGVENQVGYVSTIAGKSLVGSATLSAEELKRMTFVVKRNQASGVEFDVSGSFVLSNEGARPRTISLTLADFALT